MRVRRWGRSPGAGHGRRPRRGSERIPGSGGYRNCRTCPGQPGTPLPARCSENGGKDTVPHAQSQFAQRQRSSGRACLSFTTESIRHRVLPVWHAMSQRHRGLDGGGSGLTRVGHCGTAEGRRRADAGLQRLILREARPERAEGAFKACIGGLSGEGPLLQLGAPERFPSAAPAKQQRQVGAFRGRRRTRLAGGLRRRAGRG
jgi:hypothetical protein